MICYVKKFYDCIEVNSKNAIRILEAIGAIDKNLNEITKERLEYLHSQGRYESHYQYGYYDKVRHELVYGKLTHYEYEDDGWGLLKYEVGPTERRIPCGDYLCISLVENEDGKLIWDNHSQYGVSYHFIAKAVYNSIYFKEKKS